MLLLFNLNALKCELQPFMSSKKLGVETQMHKPVGTVTFLCKYCAGKRPVWSWVWVFFQEEDIFFPIRRRVSGYF